MTAMTHETNVLTEHDGLRQDGQPDQRVGTGQFAQGQVDPVEAGKQGGQTGGSAGGQASGGSGGSGGSGQFAGGKVRISGITVDSMLTCSIGRPSGGRQEGWKFLMDMEHWQHQSRSLPSCITM